MGKEEKKKLKMIIGITTFICIMAIIVKQFDFIYNFFDKITKLTYPFILGMFIAYLLTPITNKVYNRLKRMKHNKDKDEHKVDTKAIAIVETIFILSVIVLFAVVIWGVVGSGYNISKQLPTAFEQTKELLDEQIQKHDILKNIVGETASDFVDSMALSVSKIFTDNFSEIFSEVVINTKHLITYTINFILGIIVSIFALASRKQFSRQADKILRAFTNDNAYKKIIEVIKEVDKKFSGFFIGKIIDSLIIGAICLVAMLILNMPYAVLVSLIVLVTNIVPIIGPIIGAIPGIIIIFSESPIKALYFAIFILILQQIDGHIIGPKCIGSAIGLNTFYVLFALIIFGGIWGFIGMIIGVPLFSAIYSLISEFVNYRIETKNKEKI